MGLFSADRPSPIFAMNIKRWGAKRQYPYKLRGRTITLYRIANKFFFNFYRKKKNEICMTQSDNIIITSTSTYLEFVKTLYTSRPEILKQLLLKMCVHDSIFRGACDKHFRWLKCVDDSRVPFFHSCTIIFRRRLHTHCCIIPRHVCTNGRTLESVRWINHARTQPRKIKTRLDENLLNFEPFNNYTRKRFFRVRVKEKERS